jgi:tRNA threonylcarbamoyladenosine biosynthesis protein TsaB
MNILAIDTCTEMCSAAVLSEGEVFEQAALTQRGHSDRILGMIDTVLAQAGITMKQIDLLAFGRGPGSFTGVRVGVGVAQGIAFARELPVVPVSTLAAVAQRAIDEHGANKVAVALDARMGEIYAGHYIAENGLAVSVDDEQVCKPEAFLPMSGDDWFAAGTGWQVYTAELERAFGGRLQHTDSTLLPTAAAIAKLARRAASRGQTIAAEQAVPVYLRDNVAKKKGEQ